MNSSAKPDGTTVNDHPEEPEAADADAGHAQASRELREGIDNLIATLTSEEALQRFDERVRQEVAEREREEEEIRIQNNKPRCCF